MKWTPWLCGSLTLALIAGCGGNKRNNDTGAAGAGTESGTMQGGTPTDTAVPSAGATDTSVGAGATSSDTSHAQMRGATADSATGNQTKSGVTNTQTGQSTMGKGVTKTRPDQGQPVTSKGDTVSAGPDSGANR